MSDREHFSDDSYEARRALRAKQAAHDREELVDLDDVQAPVPGPGLSPSKGQESLRDENKPKTARKKLAYEHLTSPAGIPHVFNTFRDAFRKQRRGIGHEAHDLGCLLDMYERWQLRLYPHCDFDAFIDKVAALHGKPGGKAIKGASLKGDMRELRNSVVQLALENTAKLNEATPPEHDVHLSEDAGNGSTEQLSEPRDCTGRSPPHGEHCAGPQPSTQISQASGMANTPGEWQWEDENDGEQRAPLCAVAPVNYETTPVGRDSVARVEPCEDDDDWMDLGDPHGLGLHVEEDEEEGFDDMLA